MVGHQCLHKCSCTSRLDHPIVVLKIASGADNFLQSISVVVCSTTITRSSNLDFQSWSTSNFTYSSPLVSLRIWASKMLPSLTPFSSVNFLCLGILHQFICENLHWFVCEVLHQLVCEGLLIVFVWGIMWRHVEYTMYVSTQSELHWMVMNEMHCTWQHWCTMLSCSDCACEC